MRRRPTGHAGGSTGLPPLTSAPRDCVTPPCYFASCKDGSVGSTDAGSEKRGGLNMHTFRRSPSEWRQKPCGGPVSLPHLPIPRTNVQPAAVSAVAANSDLRPRMGLLPNALFPSTPPREPGRLPTIYSPTTGRYVASSARVSERCPHSTLARVARATPVAFPLRARARSSERLRDSMTPASGHRRAGGFTSC